jgi:hypothetical protein
MSNVIIVIVSDVPTARPSESRPHNVARRRHVLRMRMHPYPWSLSGSDGDFRYSVLCDYYISIS